MRAAIPMSTSARARSERTASQSIRRRCGVVPFSTSISPTPPPPARLPVNALADRRGVDQAALGPQLVDAGAGKLELRALADGGVVDLAVIADLLDRLIGPVGFQAQPLGGCLVLAEQELHLRRARRF